MSHRIVFPVLAALAGCAWASACGDEPPRATKVRVFPYGADLTSLGATMDFGAEVLDQYGEVMPGAPVSWSSSSPPVATVDESGLVTARGNGTATITAAAGTLSGSVAVSVMQSVRSVAVSPALDTVELRDTVRLTAEALDGNGHAVADAEFAWSSSDPQVAVVDTGLVTATGRGTATITAVAESVGGSAEITVVDLEREVLEAFYLATDGPNWVNNGNWMSDAELRHWYGVQTTDGTVRVLDLRQPALRPDPAPTRLPPPPDGPPPLRQPALRSDPGRTGPPRQPGRSPPRRQ